MIEIVLFQMAACGADQDANLTKNVSNPLERGFTPGEFSGILDASQLGAICPR
ncbi:MAG: hypothetical protein U9R15_08140 [Chloroflexota bacterium]|nr:hypothetical protein [Chloroflexota bacterium]